MTVLDPARAAARNNLESDAATATRLAVRLVDGDPAPAIGEILFELVKGAVAWSQGRRRTALRAFGRANMGLTTLRVQLDAAMAAERLPKRRR